MRINRSHIHNSHGLEGVEVKEKSFFPPSGRCCAALRLKQKVNLFCLIFLIFLTQNPLPGGQVEAPEDCEKEEDNNGGTDSFARLLGEKEKK